MYHVGIKRTENQIRYPPDLSTKTINLEHGTAKLVVVIILGYNLRDNDRQRTSPFELNVLGGTDSLCELYSTFENH